VQSAPPGLWLCAGRVVLLLALLALSACLPPGLSRLTAQGQPGATPRPPLTPRWAYEPWVWEDELHSDQAVRDLVDGYRQRDIPVGAIIVDSPWETNYNTFQFGPDYPDPGGLIGELHAQGVRVLLWSTPFVNVASTDGPDRGKAPLYDEAAAAGYFVDGGRVYKWGHGRGSAVDFFNPRALAWWYAQMDSAFALGVDGWKVDNGEKSLPDEVETAAGRRTLREYREAYYGAYYRYVAERNPDAIIAARPYAFETTSAVGNDRAGFDPAAMAALRANNGGTVYAPLEANPAGWVGDQSPDWSGLEEALDNILASAERGYAVLGSDIGGFLVGRRLPTTFIRWAELGALSPLMENGGRGEHRPWRLSAEALAAYRYYAKLHHELVPYLFNAGVEAHLTGQPIIREADRQGRQYLLGADLLVAPIVSDEDERDVSLPPGARWYDYWDDDRVLDGPAVVRQAAPPERVPLYIRGGAIIPLQVDDGETGHGGPGSRGWLTLLVYPDGDSARTYHPDAGRSLELRSRREASGVTVEIGRQSERYVLRVKEPSAPDGPRIERGGAASALPPLPSREAFDGAAEGWYYDAARHELWARFATEDSAARLSYATPG
jgi:alpha-glucosidase (family GH31 glycosyl hydrolase)